MSLSAVFRRFLPEQPIPKELQKTFIHLFIEMSWIGVLGGTTLSFLSVYAARLGGTPNQIGLISAVPALVNLLFAIPANGLIRGRPLGLTSFWGAALARIFYLSFALLPIFFAPQIEVWVIILVTLIMNIPLTVLNVSFNAMMIESIPGDWRAFVVGTRNALLSVFQLIFQLLSGLVLKNMDFPIGYQVVFFAGFLGAAMSTVHLFYLRRLGPQPAAQTTTPSKGITWRAWLPDLGVSSARTKYIRVLLLLFCFHIAQWLVIPVVPLFSVDFLRLDDFQISLGGGLFNLIVFAGSFFLTSVTTKIGNHRATAISVIGLGFYPLLLSFSRGFGLYSVAHLVGGVSWAILAGASFNYLAENAPEGHRAQAISWYILVSNASILIGSSMGPVFVNWIGFPAALLLFAILRMLSGLAILRWG